MLELPFTANVTCWHSSGLPTVHWVHGHQLHWLTIGVDPVVVDSVVVDSVVVESVVEDSDVVDSVDVGSVVVDSTDVDLFSHFLPFSLNPGPHFVQITSPFLFFLHFDPSKQYSLQLLQWPLTFTVPTSLQMHFLNSLFFLKPLGHLAKHFPSCKYLFLPQLVQFNSPCLQEPPLPQCVSQFWQESSILINPGPHVVHNNSPSVSRHDAPSPHSREQSA